jgi:hypothetical protein
MRYSGNNGGHYGATSVKGCAQNGRGWKPVCDHPSYCRNDRKSIYLGQQHHMAYGGHWHKNYMPRGLFVYKRAFRQDGMCYYTGNHGGKHRDLCARHNSHWWRTATQNRFYMCAKVTGRWNWHGSSRVIRTYHNIRLAGRNGVPARRYTFREMRYDGHHSGDYSLTARKGCAKNGRGWKPVCDHPSYCRNDRNAIYLGQAHHMAYGGHWHNSYMPRGLFVYKNRFRRDGMCYYTGNHGGKHQNLCARGNSHWWRRATQSRYYMCARILGGWTPNHWRNAHLSCRTNTAHSNRAGVIRARLSGGYTMVGGGINNHYRHFNRLSAFEESMPEGNNWRCDTGFGPGRLTCYSRMCRMSGMHCTTRSVHKNGHGIAYAHLPGGYVATGGGVYNHYRHFNKHSAFETSIPHGNRSWRCDMGLGYGRFNCYVRGCRATHNKRLHCITRTSRSGNWHNVQCPGGYSVTGCGQNEQRRQWNHLSGFEEMRVHGNGCVCDSGFGGGRNVCYTRCCKMQVRRL